MARRGDENCPFRQLLPGSDRSAGEGPEALFTGRPGFYRPAHKALSASGRGMLFPSSETLALVMAGDSELQQGGSSRTSAPNSERPRKPSAVSPGGVMCRQSGRDRSLDVTPPVAGSNISVDTSLLLRRL